MTELVDAPTEAAKFINIKTLQPALSKLVIRLQADVRERCEERSDVNAPLMKEYQDARDANRTLETFQSWREAYLNQVAVAWVLATVFVRYLEDHQLIDKVWLAGQGERAREVRERHADYFRRFPLHSDRDYFHHVFDEVAKLPGCAELFGRDRNPLWKFGISGDGAKVLREFWQDVDPATGSLRWSVSTPEGDTRFLGDLYQNLSEDARKRFALLQTPEFVQEFILDYTLEPAIREFGLEQVRLIDPTCGSGHFLLGAFSRLLGHWQTSAPGLSEREIAKRALFAVHGVDLNPFAVAIARFRLLIAYLRACGLYRLAECPGVSTNVATGDSLLHGCTLTTVKGQHELFAWAPEAFAVGDFEDAERILLQKYHVVVGNPPYIVDADKAHNNAVRDRYRTCYRQFSLGVPFTERFFDLAVEAQAGLSRAGFVGMITANSFMKREFGKRLIEAYFPACDLTHVLDCSGAYLPGHGTPTVILFGRHRFPAAPSLRAILGIRGEPSTPDDPAQGKVWRSIVELVESPGTENMFVSSVEVVRETFHRHPWSIGGGGAAELKEQIEEAGVVCLGAVIDDLGRTTHTGEDEVFLLPCDVPLRMGFPAFSVPLIPGDAVRDYLIDSNTCALLPYDHLELAPLCPLPAVLQAYLWDYRSNLRNRRDFGQCIEERGLKWFEHSMFFKKRFRAPLSIAFAFVATHNHFVLDRGGKVFNRTAPVIKLPDGANLDDHLALLGLLNSSTACFWFKQTGQNRGSTVDEHGARQRTIPFEDFWEISGAQAEKFPLPACREATLALARSLDQLAGEFVTLSPQAVCAHAVPTRLALDSAREKQLALRASMVTLQEELDWLCYELYGIVAEAPRADLETLPPLSLGQRAFEIQLARGGEETTWFARHGSVPITELPSHWPNDYRAIVEKRLNIIASDRNLQLVEKPEHKRRWSQAPWEERERSALRDWLHGRLEGPALWADKGPLNCGQLAQMLRKDDDFLNVLALYLGRDDFDLTRSLQDLLLSEAVPYLAALRYSEGGLRKRGDWERTWELQRSEDRAENVGVIPVPPKYASADFLKSEYYKHRGKLDVPKERFILYPLTERESDQSALLGWAGWNHLQRAQALAHFYHQVKENEAWVGERLLPLLAGLAELVPWLKQWHNEVDPEFGERMGDYYESFVREEVRELGHVWADLKAWRPPTKVKAAKSKKS